MTLKHYFFGNLGRDKNVNKSSRGLDLHALRGLRRRATNKHTAIFLCEINEGDDNNELELVRKIFPDWKIYGAKTREPILLSPDQPKAKARVVEVPDSAVKLWSPTRHVTVVHLADEPVSLVGVHPAAGANGQGDRPVSVRGELQTSWDNAIRKRNAIKRGLHKRGRNVVEMLDANAYNLNTLPLMPGEKVVVHDATDWGRVWAAEGYAPRFRPGKPIPFRIDSHDGLVMHGNFKKK